jgi:osmoprotectant transport system permease protein
LLLVAPITGFFSITTAEVALVSYTLLILLRNTIAGLDSVPKEVHDAARGMGYTPLEELRKVQLPLALPSILAGVRVATVTVVGLVNVTDFNTEIVVGLVLSVILAGVADAFIVGAERLSLPWARSRSAVSR